MSYLVLARKYRPQTFEEVLHQEHVTRTLANAVSAGRLAHAVLLSGPRGTGKTTVARILAKAVNCKKGPTPTPCNRCRSCREITRGNAADVFEIDGASNNSVDQVRELRENARYMPAYSPYKIYIIDEVHMLSLAAFNALLKTLEEPPAHVLFIFATTEPHKLPATILSRCQRHDFRRIHTRSIVAHLESIVSKENVAVDPESLWVIAREASGGMRDALSLLDQVMTCAEGRITLDRVLDLLGIMNRKEVFELARAVLEKDAPAVLERIHEAYARGYDMKRLYFDLVEHFRNLMVAKACRESGPLMDLPGGEIEQIQKQAEGVSLFHLRQISDVLLEEEPAIRFSLTPRIALEMALVKALEVVPALPIETLIEKLDTLRQRMLSLASKEAPPPETPLTATGTSEADTSGFDPGKALSRTASPESVPEDDTPAPPANPEAGPEPGEPWERVIQALLGKAPSAAGSLSKCRLVRKAGSVLEIEVNGNGYDMQVLNRKKNKTALDKACQAVYGRPMTVRFIQGKKKEAPAPSKETSQNHMKKEAIQHPLVAEAKRIFGGTVVDVKIL